jgi:sugar phosphate isomerase/epimerase
MHWSDNYGDRDSHLAVGTGNIAWVPIFAAGGSWEAATVTLEIPDLSAIQRSLAFLTKRGVHATGQRDRELRPALASRVD